MALTFIKPRQRIEVKEKSRFFQAIGDYPGNGYSFPCDEEGNIEDGWENKTWARGYKYCLENPDKFEDQGIRTETYSYTEPALVKCHCGTEFYLDGDTQCDGCGCWYNGFGQQLKDPKYWDTDADGDEEWW